MSPLLPVDEGAGLDETVPLLRQTAPSHHGIPTRITRRLYVSHFLSTWNTRAFEFGAVLYLAAIFPGTLLPMSVYALTRGLSAILFAPAVGQYIDSGNRLKVVRVSIVYQRIAVAASCAVLYVLCIKLPLGVGSRIGMLVLVVLLACIEKLCSIMNMVAVEKDWVIVVADKDPEALRTLNSQMRRIDLMCKLLGPLFIATIDAFDTKVAIILNFAMNAASVVVEYYAIARVYHEVPDLQQPKSDLQIAAEEEESSEALSKFWFVRAREHISKSVKKSTADFGLYFRHRLFLPSISGALLYLTVLSFSGQMVTYLLSAGYTSLQVGVARTLSVVFEMLATWIAPWLIGHIGAVRAGLWFISYQVTMLIAGFAVFWAKEKSPVISASGLVGGTILSRVGLWGFDLCVQLIIQEDVEPENRGAFSSVEAAWQSAFDLLSYASTIIFFRPDQFKWPSLISTVAVTAASIGYAVFVRKRRGHLLHLDAIRRFGKGNSQ